MMTTKNPIYWQDEILQILFWMREKDWVKWLH